MSDALPSDGAQLAFSQRHSRDCGELLWTAHDIAVAWGRTVNHVSDTIARWERATGQRSGWLARRSMAPMPDGRMGHPLYRWRVLDAAQFAALCAWRRSLAGIADRRQLRARPAAPPAVTSE
jgi:hypothetical protein